jgi:nucleoside-diphosphate-sugar epimerase
MIIGNGLIASAFSKALFESAHHVIFASGVSNSLATNPELFQREISLVKHHIAKNTTFVYFSTTSIFDPTKQDSIYITHKKSVESLIRKMAPSFVIVRLPIMVSSGNNPHTLINYLHNAITKQIPMSLYKNACRHLLDIDDLFDLLNPYLVPDPVQLQINIPGSEKITIPDLVYEIETIVNMHGQYSWIDIGACYDIPKDAGECIYINEEQYIKRILRKYLDLKKNK